MKEIIRCVFPDRLMKLSHSAETLEILNLRPDLAGDCNRYDYARNRRPIFHRHKELELNFVISGHAQYLLPDARFDVRRHSLCWLFPGHAHVLLNESPDFAMWVVVFRPELIRRTAASAWAETLNADAPPGRFIRTVRGDAATRLEALLTETASARSEPDLFNAALAYALLHAWKVFERADGEQTGTDLHPAVEQALRVLREEDDPLLVTEIARRVCLSASRLSHLFREQTGLTLGQFRDRRRIERFLDLRESEPTWTLSNCALRAGFGSYTQFYRVYKAQIGSGPRESIRWSGERVNEIHSLAGEAPSVFRTRDV